MKQHKTKVGVPYKRGKKYIYYLKLPDETGKKKTWFSKTFDTFEEAEADSKKRQNFLNHIETKPALMDKLSDYLDKWLKQKYFYQVKPSTYTSAEANIRLHINPVLGKKSVSSITKDDVDMLINSLKQKGLGSSSIYYVKNTLSRAYNQGIEDMLFSFNPCSKVKLPPKPKYHRELLEKSEIEEFLEVARNHGIYLEVLFGITYGLRMGEILGLRFKDINLRRKILVPLVQVSKGYSNNPLFSDKPKLNFIVNSDLKTGESTGRTLNITNEMATFIKALKEKYIEEGVATKETIDNCYIFCKPDGSYRKQNYLKNRFRKVRTEYGLPKLRFHDLRHTFASVLLEDGVPIATVSNALGHASIDTTFKSYYDVISGGKQIAGKMGEIVGNADINCVNKPRKR